MTSQERVSYAARWLVEHEALPLADRAAAALVIAAGGDPDARVTYEDIALYLKCSPTDARTALLSMGERYEAWLFERHEMALEIHNAAYTRLEHARCNGRQSAEYREALDEVREAGALVRAVARGGSASSEIEP